MPYQLENEKADRAISELLDALDIESEKDRSYIEQIITTAGKLVRDEASELELKLITNSLKEIRYAFHIFSRYRDRRRITVFGSSRSEPESARYRAAEQFSKRAAEEGFMLISGAGPGIMEAVNKGAGRENSFGLHINLPFEDRPNRFIRGDEKCIHFRYFFSRKLSFAKGTDAVVLFPGGVGTHDELFEILTLLQTGRHHMVPMVLVDAEGFWETFEEYLMENLIQNGTISESDLSLYDRVSGPDEALEVIQQFYRNYHSSRFVEDEFVIRLRYPPGSEELENLEDQYGDLCPESGFSIRKEPLHGVKNPPDEDLYRLVFHFTNKNYGVLRSMIRTINMWGTEEEERTCTEDGDPV